MIFAKIYFLFCQSYLSTNTISISHIIYVHKTHINTSNSYLLTMSDYNLRLYYFGIAGKAESMRLAFNYAGINFEDYIMNREEFIAKKESGELGFGQVPALKVDKKGDSSDQSNLLVQSGSIMRFIGEIDQSGKQLFPNDPVARAKIGAIIDQEADCFGPFRTVNYRSRMGLASIEEDQAAKLKNEINETFHNMQFEFLDRLLNSSKSGWIAGTENASIADFMWVPTLMAVQKGWTGGCQKLTPTLTKYVEKFLALPENQKYYETHEYKIWW